MDGNPLDFGPVKLRGIDSAASAAFEFLILTASRTSEIIHMPWDEAPALDALKPTWSIPKERMKMDRGHEVPLSNRAKS